MKGAFSCSRERHLYTSLTVFHSYAIQIVVSYTVDRH